MITRLFSNRYIRIHSASHRTPPQGIAALITIVILGAAALLMSFTASFLGLGEIEMGYDSQQGAEAQSLADGCADETLRRLRVTSTYSGGTLSLGDGSCIIQVTSDGTNRTITITSTLDSYYTVIHADVTVSGTIITVEDWEEI